MGSSKSVMAASRSLFGGWTSLAIQGTSRRRLLDSFILMILMRQHYIAEKLVSGN